MGAYQTILWSLMNDSDSKGVTLSEWLIGAYRSVSFRYPVLEYKGLLLLYPLLALVVSALLNSQYTEFHLERRLRPAYTVRWLLTSDTPEPPLKSFYELIKML